MHWTTPLKQEWLFRYQNPLEKLVGRDFFRNLPKEPGVYRFYGRFAGQAEALLYVGKAKDLRVRLNSYRRAMPEIVSRKVLWMLSQTRRIEYEICPSERAALLRENELLRSLRPPFNVLNTSPEDYRAIGILKTSTGIRIRVADTHELEDEPGERLYGVFKSRGAVRDSVGALLRLLWMAGQSPDEDEERAKRGRYEIPSQLLRYRPPNPYLLQGSHSPTLLKSLDRFLSGHSRALLRGLTRELLEKSAIPPLFYPRIQEDLELLSDFFKVYCTKNRKLCRHFEREGSFISPHEIDDWLVVFRTSQPSKPLKPKAKKR